MRATQPSIVVVRSPSVSSTAGAFDVDIHEEERADVVSELRRTLRNDDDDDDGSRNVAHARGDSACSADGCVIDDDR
jgi:hypothetical protein